MGGFGLWLGRLCDLGCRLSFSCCLGLFERRFFSDFFDGFWLGGCRFSYILRHRRLREGFSNLWFLREGGSFGLRSWGSRL